MKSVLLATLALSFSLIGCGQDQNSSELAATRVNPAGASSSSSLTLAPLVQKVIAGKDAEQIIAILERAGVERQSAIESTFFRMDEASCQSGQITSCQFSIGGGLFVQSEFRDTEALIRLLRKNRSSSQAIQGGRRWDLFNLECSTRFVLASRKLQSTCTFQQSEL